MGKWKYYFLKKVENLFWGDPLGKIMILLYMKYIKFILLLFLVIDHLKISCGSW